MKKISAIIFDMDGVIIDSEPVQMKAMNIAISDYNVQIDEAEWELAAGRRTRDTIEYLTKKYKITESIENLIEKKNRIYRNLIATDIVMMPDISFVLESLKNSGYLLSIASSSVADDIYLVLNNFSLTQYFDAIVSGDQVKNGKPAPDIFLKAIDKLNTSNVNSVVVEDTFFGVQAAKAAGIRCIAIPNKLTKNQDFSFADLVLSEIKSLLIHIKDF